MLIESYEFGIELMVFTDETFMVWYRGNRGV